jgi:HlyD family secretion protein
VEGTFSRRRHVGEAVTERRLQTEGRESMISKTWWILGGVTLAAALIWLSASHFSSGVAVETVPVTTGPIREFVDEQATTRLPETYLITMPLAGRIAPIEPAEGTPVTEGQVVARIVPRDTELTVKQAAAVVDRLEAAIRKNADISVEGTAVEQAVQFVRSMEDTVEMARERVRAGTEKHAYAERNFGRVQALYTRGATTDDELDRAKLEFVEASVSLAQDKLVLSANESLKLATDLLPTMIRQYIDRKKLDEAVLEKEKAEAEARLQQVIEDQRRSVMTSPVDGVVLARHITNERFLTAGTILLEIGRLEDLEVEADVLSLDVVAAEAGDPVEIYGPAIGAVPARGTVQRIYPAGFTKISSLGVEQQRVKVIVGFEPEDLARVRAERDLGVGYRVRVRIITAQKAQAKVIPRSALFRGDDGHWQVHVVQGGRMRTRDLQIGMLNDELAEVLAGLEENELVVRAPQSALEDGLRVTPK